MLAAALTGVLIFGGLITAVYGCTIAFPDRALLGGHALPAAANPAGAPEMPDCGDGAKPSDVSTNACEAHCITGQSLEVQTHAPSALAASPPPLHVAVPARASTPTATARAGLSSLARDPPPLLRFARRLI